MQQQFQSAILAWMGMDPDVVSRPGVSVAGHAERADNHVTAGYVIGDHLAISCDPAVEDMLREATADIEPTFASWETVALAAGGELLGAGRSQLLGDAPLPEVELADGYSLRTLDATIPDHYALIERLAEASNEDDLDEAEIELDNLDDIIEVVVDASGEIASFASSRPFDMAGEFGDIGIMTRPSSRGKGLASAAVVAVCDSIRRAGFEPLYRCDEDNTGSVALSASLGFSIATQVVAYRFPH